MPEASSVSLAMWASAYVITVNLACFVAFAWDKRSARRGRRRVRERTLLILAGLGGSIGALVARSRFRHKTHKQPFQSRLFCIVGLQSAALAAITFLLLRG